jgi:DNA polymerase-3 subunit delta'
VSWQRVRGHDDLVQAFEHVWRRGRLAHAYLFVGPEGIGKRLFAQELAAALLCEKPPDRLEACGRCAACALTSAGTHPDFFVLNRPEEGNVIPIESMRELCAGLALKSARGKGKVAVIDDADDLHDESANCFLKTLEEPPPGSVLILIGTARDKQMPTILSRCQVVPFRPLSEALIAELLGQQGVTDPALVARLVRLSDGSLAQALALADPALWEARRELLEGLARPQPDTVGLARNWMKFVEKAGKETAAQRRRASLSFRLLIASLNDALRLSLGGTPRLADADELGLLRGLADRVGPDALLQLIERCLEADEQIGRYVQIVLVLEGLLDALGQVIRDSRPQGERV